MPAENQVKKDRGHIALLIVSWVLGVYWVIDMAGSDSSISAYAGALAFTFIVGGTCDYFRMGGFGITADKVPGGFMTRFMVIASSLGFGLLLMLGLKNL